MWESTDHFKKRKQKDRKEEWSQKVVHGQFTRQSPDVEDTKSWLWLQKGYLKMETLSLITAECAKRKIIVSCTSFQHAVDRHRKSTRRDMMTWGKLSTGNSVE